MVNMSQPISVACHLNKELFFAFVEDFLIGKLCCDISVGPRRNAIPFAQNVTTNTK